MNKSLKLLTDFEISILFTLVGTSRIWALKYNATMLRVLLRQLGENSRKIGLSKLLLVFSVRLWVNSAP